MILILILILILAPLLRPRGPCTVVPSKGQNKRCGWGLGSASESLSIYDKFGMITPESFQAALALL